MYKAREMLRNDVVLNATFGNRDALASMMSGAISAAMMNITEYVTEEKSYIQIWKQEITSARNTLIFVHSVTDFFLFLGGILCAGYGPACISATAISQTVTVVGEIPTYYTMNKIDTLLNDAHNRADSYLTEKGKQAKELANFLRAMLAMNETQIAPVVFLGEMVASYVSKNAASKATKTAADVLSDLDSMSRVELDADVKTMAGMLFDDDPPPDVLLGSIVNSVFRALFLIGAGVSVYYRILGTRSFTAKYNKGKSWLDDNPGFKLKHPENELQALQESEAYMTDFIHRLQNNLGLTKVEAMIIFSKERALMKNTDLRDQFILDDMFVNEIQIGNNGEQPYKFSQFYRQERAKYMKQGRVTLEEVTTEISNLKNNIRLSNQAANEPTLRNMAKEKWFKNTSKGMIWFAVAAAAVDGIITSAQIDQINDYIDSVVSKRTSTLEATAGVLGAWQELHTTT
jgi:hypothetical protein